MEIIRENTGEMTAQLRIKITREDYLERTEKELKKLQKDMVLPGFRKGKVPMGHVKRLYGQAIVVDEVNKMLSEALQKYIDENQLDLLGYPLAGKNSKPFNPETETEHEFRFDLGLAPSFELNLEAVSGLTYTQLVPGDEDIDKEIENYRHQFAQVEPQEVSDENSIFEGTLVEVNENGEPVEGGYNTQRAFHLHSDMVDADAKVAFIGVKAGAKVSFKTVSIAALAKFAEVTEEKAQQIKDRLVFEIEEIKKEVLPDLNVEFFNQVFPHQNIQTEEEFRKEVGQRIQLGWMQRIADQRFLNEVADRFIETHHIPLPDEFLKRWIVANSEGKITQEEVEKDYDKKFAKGIRWELIESKLREKAKMEITPDDLRERMKRDLIENYFGFLKYSPEGDARLDALATDMLKSEEQARKVYNELNEEKLIVYLRDNLQVNIVEQSINEYFDSFKKQPTQVGEQETDTPDNAQ